MEQTTNNQATATPIVNNPAPVKTDKSNDNKDKNNKQQPLTVAEINKNEKVRQQYIDKLLQQLANDKTTKNDKKLVRRFLRSLNHRGGLRSSKYSKTKSINDFVKI